MKKVQLSMKQPSPNAHPYFFCLRSLQSCWLPSGHLCVLSRWLGTGIILAFPQSFFAGFRAWLQAGAKRHSSLLENSIEPTFVRYFRNARIMLPANIAPKNIFCSELNPCAETVICLFWNTSDRELWQRQKYLQTRCLSVHNLPKPKLAARGKSPHAIYSLIAS
jgi:hypothetical protein